MFANTELALVKAFEKARQSDMHAVELISFACKIAKARDQMIRADDNFCRLRLEIDDRIAALENRSIDDD